MSPRSIRAAIVGYDRMSIEQVRIRLGDEFDDALRDAVRGVLTELGAELTGTSWGVGGSQEIETLEAVVDGERIVVETETYAGLTVSGGKRIVERIADKIRARLGR